MGSNNFLFDGGFCSSGEVERLHVLRHIVAET